MSCTHHSFVMNLDTNRASATAFCILHEESSIRSSFTRHMYFMPGGNKEKQLGSAHDLNSANALVDVSFASFGTSGLQSNQQPPHLFRSFVSLATPAVSKSSSSLHPRVHLEFFPAKSPTFVTFQRSLPTSESYLSFADSLQPFKTIIYQPNQLAILVDSPLVCLPFEYIARRS